MIHVMASIVVKPEHAAAARTLLVELAAASRGEAGCLSYELYQRPDDKREVVANRVAVYLRDTLPVVKRYERQAVLRHIDGNQSIEAVKVALRQAVGVDAPIPV